MALKFIDIFSGSGTEIAGRSDVDGVIIKATQGTTYVNPLCNAQYALAKQKGRLLGLYHYAAGGDPVAEANYFIANIKNYVGETVLVLDWESYQNSAWGTIGWGEKFVNRIHELTGVWPLLYTGLDGIRQNKSLATKCGLWFAGYPDNRDSWTVPTFSYNISPWSTYTLWQFSSSNGKLDRNVAAVDANGWRKIANPSGTTKPVTPSKPVVKPTPAVPAYSTAGKTLEAMANDVMAGKVGSGATRAKLLGRYATSVQVLVNYKMKTVSATSLNSTLASEVKKGVFGAGATRQKLLGSYYNGVQAVINKSVVVHTYYTVKSGDSFWSIAQKYGVDMNKLASQNKLTIKSVIHPGQKLLIK
ncbi:GH25 family lysozyme [Lapidilactobacillus mulanensis]|uniref:GH25 family lysozyme n=1 Tax=Lapidilactobacillus mulanensis TaxID=2485999 RepID=A0ABW4DPA7_9LACO|nr:GH25 family lysozyme [Lapidilactobacillus mulanensis]